MKSARLVAVLLLAVSSGGCFRLSDPFYAFKEIHAEEPDKEHTALIFGTIVVDHGGMGDLSSVDLEKIGPGKETTFIDTNRVNLFRVFFRRTMKDNNFVMEVGPGLYQVASFSTSALGQPHIWTAKPEARQAMRILVTRPGIYDIGAIHVARSTGYNQYEMTLAPDHSPARQQVLRQAIAGTAWERLAAPR